MSGYTPDPPPRLKGRLIEEVVFIAGSAESVWSTLADVAGWGQWNPVYTEARGTLVRDGAIDLVIVLPGAAPQRMKARIFHLAEGRSLQFGASVFGGLLHARRSIQVEPQVGGGCLVRNGEALSGLLGGLFARLGGASIRLGLRSQNQGLKRFVEARANGSPPA